MKVNQIIALALGTSVIALGSLSVSPILANQASISLQQQVSSCKDNSKCQNNQQVVQEIVQLALEGKVLDVEEFGLNSKKRDILKKWPTPDKEGENSLTYWDKNVTFHFNKNNEVDAITANLSMGLLEFPYPNSRIPYIIIGPSKYHLQPDDVKSIFGSPLSEEKGSFGISMLYVLKNGTPISFHQFGGNPFQYTIRSSLRD